MRKRDFIYLAKIGFLHTKLSKKRIKTYSLYANCFSMKAVKEMIFIIDKILADVKKHSIFAALYNAKVAQLVERQPSKLNVASSNLVFRSKSLIRNNKAFLMLNFTELIYKSALFFLSQTSFN